MFPCLELVHLPLKLMIHFVVSWKLHLIFLLLGSLTLFLCFFVGHDIDLGLLWGECSLVWVLVGLYSCVWKNNVLLTLSAFFLHSKLCGRNNVSAPHQYTIRLLCVCFLSSVIEASSTAVLYSLVVPAAWCWNHTDHSCMHILIFLVLHLMVKPN